jgi:hypothetical protein
VKESVVKKESVVNETVEKNENGREKVNVEERVNAEEMEFHCANRPKHTSVTVSVDFSGWLTPPYAMKKMIANDEVTRYS